MIVNSELYGMWTEDDDDDDDGMWKSSWLLQSTAQNFLVLKKIIVLHTHFFLIQQNIIYSWPDFACIQ
jgi:hypothetical protein